MKKIIIILLVTIIATAIGLYFRPELPLIGQLDWWNVITKGYFVGAIAGLFSQGFIDDSFWFVMRFTGAGFVMGILAAFMMGGKSSSGSSAKKKK